MDTVDSIVIGAGVVGLACGRALALAGREVMVLEKALSIGTGVSARNSEVIHAGLYYPTGSLKAKLCVQGAAMMMAQCASHGVAFKRVGKLVVATDTSQHAALQALQAKAIANGVTVAWLSAEQAMALEPALYCTAALHSPNTGIVDSHGFMLSLQGDLEHAGGMVALGAEAVSIKLGSALNRLHSVCMADGTELLARHIVNAASLHACDIAARMAGLGAQHVPKAYFAKGSYFTLAGTSPFSRLIYPAPQDAWLGVHATLDLGGQCKFGPDMEWLDIQSAAQIDAINYAVDPRRAESFYAAVRSYYPALADGALQPSYSGVRPKIYGSSQAAPDFVIQGPAIHGVAGLVNLFGIESPGLTASMAIADEIVATLAV